MFPILAVILVFLGCSSNVVFLEILIREDPGCGNLITFCQFLLIAVEGLIVTSKFLTRKPVVPLSYYLTMVVMFFIVSIANNYALNFNISMPLQMIFKSGSLIANMVLGIILLKKRYKFSKYASIIMITIGILLCTIASGPSKPALSPETTSQGTSEEDWTWVYWLFGIFLLTFALFLSAQMGIYQEILYSKFGKHPREALFYSHALPLPAFLMFGKDIYNHVLIFNQSDPFNIPIIGEVPKLWIYLLLNVLTQYVCIRSVFVLTTEFSSLTVTVVITLRKFISLLFSIFYFQNPFTNAHWLGTGLVFIGTLIFTDLLNMLQQRKPQSTKSKSQ